MITFKDWVISSDREVISRQGDNLTRSIEILGDFPDGWTWALLVQLDGTTDVIPLEREDGGLKAVLTRDQLAAGNRQYTLQLRGSLGELVRHSNTIAAYIPRSILPEAHWPTIPSEFTQFELRIMDAVRRAEEAAARAEAAAGGAT